MDKQTHRKIRELLTKQGAWDFVQNFQIYTTEEFISECETNQATGEKWVNGGLTDETKKLLRTHVKRLQKYCDDRILEPITKVF